MSNHEIVGFIVLVECSCGEQVAAASDQRAEQLMAEHVCAARAAERDTRLAEPTSEGSA